MKILKVVVLALFLAGFAGTVYAVGPDWMSQGDYEQDVSTTSQNLFNGLVFAAAAVGAITIVVGLIMYSGWIGERQTGVNTIKAGALIIIASLVIGGILAWLSGGS
jgi:hypothetical protein